MAGESPLLLFDVSAANSRRRPAPTQGQNGERCSALTTKEDGVISRHGNQESDILFEADLMLALAVTILAYLMLSWITQLILCQLYARAVRTASSDLDARTSPAGGEMPRICVLMPLRGADPHLAAAIRSVVENGYPNLQLRIVVDDPDDPAWAVVEDTVESLGADNVRVSILRDKPAQCSLICSSLIQAFDESAETCDLISFCAADMVVPANWYWDSVDAMRDPAVGSLLGNRWYMPVKGRWGSLVRYAWNAGAVVLMCLFKIPWGGALALRPEDVRRSELRELWETSMVEDVPVYDAMRRLGLQMKFVPSLTMVNREEIGLGGAFRFLKRQMIWARLYHPRWTLVVAHSLMGLLSLAGPIVLAGWALAVGKPGIAAGLFGGVAAYVAGLALLAGLLESSVRSVLRVRNEEIGRWTVGWVVRLTLAIALTQLFYPLAVIACCFAREVNWRGVRYRILGRGKVRMVQYVPFRAESQPADSETSI